MDKPVHISKFYKVIAMAVTFFLFLTFNPFLLWIIEPALLIIPTYGFVILVSISLFFRKEMVVSMNRMLLVIFMLIFVTHVTFHISGENFLVVRFLSFSTFILILFYPPVLYYLIFKYFRQLMIIFAGFAVALFFLTLVGVKLPYIYVTGFTLPMLPTKAFYMIYGPVVSSSNSIFYTGGLVIARSCGPFLEPGHFGIYLGIVLSIEKVLYKKLTKLLILAGFLTLSPAFYFIILIIILYDLFIKKKTGLAISISVILLFVFTMVVSASIRNDIYDITVGKVLGDEVGYIIDSRTGQYSLAAYEKFTNSNHLFLGRGGEFVKKYGILSDIRGLFFKFGILGLTLVILMLLLILSKLKRFEFLMFFLIAGLILLHRSWMYTNVYLYLLFVIAVGVSSEKNYKELESD